MNTILHYEKSDDIQPIPHRPILPGDPNIGPLYRWQAADTTAVPHNPVSGSRPTDNPFTCAPCEQRLREWNAKYKGMSGLSQFQSGERRGWLDRPGARILLPTAIAAGAAYIFGYAFDSKTELAAIATALGVASSELIRYVAQGR